MNSGQMPVMSVKIGLLVVMLCVTVTLVANGAGNAEDLQDFLDALDRTVEQVMTRHFIPGAAIVLVENQEIVAMRGYGVGNRLEGWPVTPETVFQVGSIAKAAAAVGAMGLVADGILALESPAEEYLTRWSFPPSRYDSALVTIEMLLSHTAGLSPRGYMGYRPVAEVPSLEDSLTGAARRGKAVRLRSEPGLVFSYSGGGYSVLELIIEEVTGMSFQDYMDEVVFLPLGMEHSSYVWTSGLQEVTATGYSAFGTPFPTYLFAEKAAAGLFSSAHDLARLQIALMASFHGDSTFLPQELVQRMWTPVVRYGLGFDIFDCPTGGRIVSHGGANQGWNSHMVMIPERGDGIVILTNSDRGALLYQDVNNLWANYQDVGYQIRVPGLLQIFLSAPVRRLMQLYY